MLRDFALGSFQPETNMSLNNVELYTYRQSNTEKRHLYQILQYYEVVAL